MDRARNHQGRPRVGSGDFVAGRFEYDRAEEKRKIHEEIEDFLTERDEKPHDVSEQVQTGENE